MVNNLYWLANEACLLFQVQFQLEETNVELRYFSPISISFIVPQFLEVDCIMYEGLCLSKDSVKLYSVVLENVPNSLYFHETALNTAGTILLDTM